jgi:ribonucleoside-diphosphate reductase alpha chain
VPWRCARSATQDAEVDQIDAHIAENADDRRRARPQGRAPARSSTSAVGERAISHTGHIDMMAATQPFISGAISKTVNLPQTPTV